jgi:hypothetical protein
MCTKYIFYEKQSKRKNQSVKKKLEKRKEIKVKNYL